MRKVQRSNDTNLELLSGYEIRGRIKNGIATIVFENFNVESQNIGFTKIYTFPKKYVTNQPIYCCFFTKNATPVVVLCLIESNGEMYAYLPTTKISLVGNITYIV